MNLKAQTKNLLFLVCQERLRKLFWFAKNGLGKAKKKTTKQWTVPRERAVYSQSARCSSSPLARGHLQIVLAKTLCCKHPLLSFQTRRKVCGELGRGREGQWCSGGLPLQLLPHSLALQQPLSRLVRACRAPCRSRAAGCGEGQIFQSNG